MPQPSHAVVMDFARTTAYRAGRPAVFIGILYEHLNLFGAFVLFNPDYVPGTDNLKEFAIQLYACWVFHAPMLSFFPPSHYIPGRPEKGKSNRLTVNEIIASAFSVAFMESRNKKEIRLGAAAYIGLVQQPILLNPVGFRLLNKSRKRFHLLLFS
jgi:hypothetical protein